MNRFEIQERDCIDLFTKRFIQFRKDYGFKASVDELDKEFHLTCHFVVSMGLFV